MHDTNGVMGLVLTQVGLFLATGLLLAVVFSLVFSNEWQRTAVLKSQASSFSNLLNNLENSFFERTSEFYFHQENYPYTVRVSTEYLVISAEGPWGQNIFVTCKLLSSPWPRLPTQNWTTGQDLHTYLNQTFGHFGTKDDRLSRENITVFRREVNNTTSVFALHPLEIQINRPVFLEKVTIYFDQVKSYDLVLVYQAPKVI